MVSTLTFGVAVQCVFDAGSPETPVAALELILLCASASLSVFTTTFSLLEYYYVTMLEGGDAWISYVGQGESGDDDATRDVFAHEGWAILEGFSARRKQARDNMWASLALILVALGETVFVHFLLKTQRDRVAIQIDKVLRITIPMMLYPVVTGATASGITSIVTVKLSVASMAIGVPAPVV